MKICISAILCFYCTFLFSQTYNFDYAVESKAENNNLDNSIEYYDSKNNARMSFEGSENKIFAVLFDENTRFRHCFKVTTVEENFIFNYSHSNDFSKEKNYNIKKELISINKIDSLNFEIIGFKTKSRKTKKFIARLTLEKSDFNFLEISIDHANSEDMMKELIKLLPENAKFFIKKIKVEFDTGVTYSNINTIRKINFSLIVPDKMNIVHYNPLKEFNN